MSQKNTIIIIDDNKAISSTLRLLLEYSERFTNQDYKIYTAHDGLEGLGLIYVLHPKSVLLDSTLPKYSGKEVSEMLSGNPKFKDTELIILKQEQDKSFSNPNFLEKTDSYFFSQLFKRISGHDLSTDFQATLISRIVLKLAKHILKLANKSDLILYKRGSRLKWLYYQLLLSFASLAFKALVPFKKTEEIATKKTAQAYRVFTYPTLVTVFSAVIFLLLQVGLFVAGGITIFSTVKLESIFALNQNQTEYVFNTNAAANYETNQIKFTNDGAVLEATEPIEIQPTAAPTEITPTEIALPTAIQPTTEPTQVQPSNTPEPTLEPTAEAEVLGASTTQNYILSDNAYLITKEATSYSKILNILEYSSENNDQSSLLQEAPNNPEVAVTYQLSPDGENWYYLENDTIWTRTEQGRISSNLIQVVNANLNEFTETFNTGELYLKIYLYTNNPEKSPVLNRIIIEKENTLITTIDEALPTDQTAEEETISALNFDKLEVEIFNASYVNGQKVVLGKVLNINKAKKTKYEITNEELALYKAKVYYANGNLIGETELYKNNRGEIEFLLRTPSSPGGYVTAQITLNDEAISPKSKEVENSTFTVDSTGDEADTSAGDGLCITAGGTCTLRAAIQEANALAGADNIYFNIPTSDTGYRDYDLPDTASSGDSTGGDDYWTIRPASALPTITEATLLDGATQATNQLDSNTLGPEVEIRGSDSFVGLTVTGTSVTINGFVVNKYGSSGINTSGISTTITGSYIGIDIKGLTDQSLATYGVLSSMGVNDLHVGTSVADGNVISGNGVAIGVSCTTGSTFTSIKGNRIGTNATGIAAIANTTAGILVGGCEVDIGGEENERNIISGNNVGVSTSVNNDTYFKIYNNFFGTDPSGTLNVKNTSQDIRIDGGTSDQSNISRIGAAGKGNLIRFGGHGIRIVRDMPIIIANNTIADTGSSGIRIGIGTQPYNYANISIYNNYFGQSDADPYFGITTGSLNTFAIWLDGASPTIQGNSINGSTRAGIFLHPQNENSRLSVSDDIFAKPQIGGQSSLVGSLCEGLQKNCITNTAWSGIYMLNTLPTNESTIFADNEFPGENGFGGETAIELAWSGLFEIFSGTSRRTDLADGTLTLNFPEGTIVRDPGVSEATLTTVTSGTNKSIACLSASDCPVSGHTSGTSGQSMFIAPSGVQLGNNYVTWYRVTEYIYDGDGNKTDYSTFKFDQPHFASGTFTFDGDSTDNVLNTGSVRTIDSQNYTDRGEPWTDKPLADRDISSGNLGRYQIMEVEYVDANPVLQEDGSYVITVDSTEDTALAAGTAYYNDGAGAASGGMIHLSTSLLANGKTSLREAIAVSNTRVGLDKVHFGIPTSDAGYDSIEEEWTITTLGSAWSLADTQGITIDGSTQPGFNDEPGGVIRIYGNETDKQILNGTGNNLTLSNLTIQGKGVGSCQVSVYIITGENILFENNIFENSAVPSSNCYIVTAGNSAIIRNNIFRNGSRGLLLFDNTAAHHSHQVTDNLFENLPSIGVSIGYSNSATVSGNTIKGFSDQGLLMNCKGTCIIEQNTWVDSATIGGWTSFLIRLSNVETHTIIRENEILHSNSNSLTLIDSTNDQSTLLIEDNSIESSNSSVAVYLPGQGQTDIRFNNNDVSQLNPSSTASIYFVNVAEVNGNTITSESKGLVIPETSILTNSTFASNIFVSEGIAIDLISASDSGAGITANDSGDADTGPNNLMNYPEITAIEYIGASQYEISGTLDNTVDGEGPFEIEVCLSSSHTSGHGGCTQSLGILENVAQNTSGPTNWSTIVTVTGDDGTQERSFTTLATNALGSTSEFGLNVDEYTIRDYPLELVYPIEDITIDTPKPQLDWITSQDPELKNYQVFLDGEQVATVPAWKSEYTLTTSIVGQHQWKIVAVRENDTTSAESSPETFTVSLNTQLESVYPINSQIIDDRTPTLDWNAISNADKSTHYDIYLDGKLVKTKAIDKATQYQVKVSEKLNLGEHSWYVVAYFREGDINQETGRTATHSFNIALNYKIEVNVDTQIDGNQYTSVIINWEIEGDLIYSDDYFLLEIVDAEGNIILSKTLSYNERSYTLTEEELALLDPAKNYTFSVKLVNTFSKDLGSTQTTVSVTTKPDSLPNTGSNEQPKNEENPNNNTPQKQNPLLSASVICIGLLLTSITIALLLFIRKKKQK